MRKNLRREVAAHPAKAATLGVLCVVALWFWAPLVWGWVAPAQGSAVIAVQEATGPLLPSFAPTVVSPAINDAESNEPYHSWQQIVEWMEQDPRTKPAGSLAAARGPVTVLLADWLPWSHRKRDGRDPFLPPQSAQRDATAEQQQDSDPALPPVPPPISPKDAGASLTGVVAGPAGGSAMINGRTYFVGEEVVVQKGGASYAFQLAEVRPGGVVLVREGVPYELDIPSPGNMPSLSRSAKARPPGTLP